MRRSLLPLFLTSLVLLIAACGSNNESSEPAEDRQPNLTLTVFDCGTIDLPDAIAFGFPEGQQPARSDIFVPCYLIEHVKGRLIFDTGLPATIASMPDGVTVTHAEPLEEQLAAMDLTPADIDLVALSHTHFDHAGQAHLFKTARHLIQQAEHTAAYSDNPPTAVDPVIMGLLEDFDFQLLDGDYDVFGDGTVTLLSTPGHTPGHQALQIRLEQTGTLILSGDLVHFPESRVQKLVPLFNTDREATLLSLERVEEIIAATGAILWIEHDPALADTLHLAPHRYR